MNGRAFLAKNKPKPARGQIDGGLDSCKAKSRASDVFDLSKVLKVIGSNVNHPILLQAGMNGLEEV